MSSLWSALSSAVEGPLPEIGVGLAARAGAVAAGLGIVALMALLTFAVMTSRRMTGSSLFNRLFVIVATTSAFFSGISSAIGFGLITSQETDDFFRNAVLPPAFGVFVFFLAVAIWVGGAELVRHRDWFRGLARGPVADAAFFVERLIKLFVVIPVLASILFFVSTWTTVVGIGGVDAVRFTYESELQRLQTECAGISAYRQKDFLFLQDLQQSVRDVQRAARNEAASGAQSGSSGQGPVADYFVGVAEWLTDLENSVTDIVEAPHPSGADPYDSELCASVTDGLKRKLASNAFVNYDLWAREFETEYNDFISVLGRWRSDRRIERLLEQQVDGFDRANPKPLRVGTSQQAAIDRYADDVESALKSLVRKQKLAKPPEPILSAAELSPARGMSIIVELFASEPVEEEAEETRKSRTESVVYNEEAIAPLSTLTPRDAVLKNASIFSDIWALAIAWDYASYILMLAYLFFPSAERGAGFKDD